MRIFAFGVAFFLTTTAAEARHSFTVVNRSTEIITGLSVLDVDEAGHVIEDALGSSDAVIKPGHSAKVSLTEGTKCGKMDIEAYSADPDFMLSQIVDTCSTKPIDLKK